MREQRRGILARIGLCLLNLIAPGLGLLRLGKWQVGVGLYVLKLVAVLFLRFGPLASFAAWALALIALVAAYIVAIALTWRASAQAESDIPAWRRWYAVIGAGLLALVVDGTLIDQDRLAYRNFYVPAESMSPTLLKGDRFVAYMRPAQWRRGDVVLVRAPTGDLYVKRLAGLPGDTIAMRNGIVILNGRPIAQHAISSVSIDEPTGRVKATRLSEQFPGEARPHVIYDLGRSPGDEFGPLSLGSDQYFMLGDHRDRSADSRFPKEEFGLEIVSREDIRGLALFYSWVSSRPIGTAIWDQR